MNQTHPQGSPEAPPPSPATSAAPAIGGPPLRLEEVPPAPDAPLPAAPPTSPPEPIARGTTILIERGTTAHLREVAELDWQRSLHPAMAGPARRSPTAPLATAFVVRSIKTGESIAVIDATVVPGYRGVVSVSIYTDTNRARGGWALEALALLIPWLFDHGARLVHHEVLELNGPVVRAMRAAGVEPCARMREHAFAAGRYWDVLVYAYDRTEFDRGLTRVLPRLGARVRRSSTPAS